MKIAEISTFSNYSVGKIMHDISNYVSCSTNSECKIFFARENSKYLNDVVISNSFLIRINALFARVFDNDGFCFSTTTKTLIKELDNYDPDIIHIHCLHGYWSNCELLFSYLSNSRAKIVWTMHDAWAFTGHCCFFSRINCYKWKTCCFSCGLKKDYPSSLFFDGSKKNFNKKKNVFTSLTRDKMIIVSPSKWLDNLIAQSFLSRYLHRVIYNGIDLSIFNCDKSNVDDNKKTLLGIASVWDERKGLNTFVDVSKMLDDTWNIILIGKISNKINLPANIIHIERTNDQNELRAYYQKSTVVFNPTQDDNYPTVNIEAQACGSKCLTFNIGGSKETDCGNLYVTDSLDLEFLVKKINEISKKQLNKIDFDKADKNRMAKEYYNLFRELNDETTY